MITAWEHTVTTARVLVTLGLIVALGDALARATIALTATDTLPAAARGPAAHSAAPAAGQRAAPERLARAIADRHLFGHPQAPLAKAPVTAPAPRKTPLNLKLNGVLLSTQGHDLAIIGAPNGPQKAYRVGATINRLTTLTAIHADYVVLQHAGRRTPLYLNKQPAGGAQPPSAADRRTAADSRVTIGADSALGTWLNRQRSVWQQNPIALMRVASIYPALENGQLRGYRLSPADDRGLFKHIGLRASDILTALNDIPLNNPTQVAGAMTQLIHADTLTLTVLRRGQPHRITVSLTPS